MTKVLNIDALASTEVRQLSLAGKKYDVREMTVDDFIEATKVAERLEGEKSQAVQMEETINLIQRSVPDIDVATLRKLSLAQMAAVSRFVRGEDVAEGEGEAGKA